MFDCFGFNITFLHIFISRIVMGMSDPGFNAIRKKSENFVFCQDFIFKLLVGKSQKNCVSSLLIL